MNKISKEQLIKEIAKHDTNFNAKSLSRTQYATLRVIMNLRRTVEVSEKSQVVREEA